MKLPTDSFTHYASIGENRSYEAVAKHYGVSKRCVVTRGVKEKWQERLAALESQAKETAQVKLAEAMEQIHERHLRSMRFVQGKAIEALRSLSLDSAMDAVRALTLAQREERALCADPREAATVTIERRVREEYQRWTVPAATNPKVTIDVEPVGAKS